MSYRPHQKYRKEKLYQATNPSYSPQSFSTDYFTQQRGFIKYLKPCCPPGQPDPPIYNPLTRTKVPYMLEEPWGPYCRKKHSHNIEGY